MVSFGSAFGGYSPRHGGILGRGPPPAFFGSSGLARLASSSWQAGPFWIHLKLRFSCQTGEFLQVLLRCWTVNGFCCRAQRRVGFFSHLDVLCSVCHVVHRLLARELHAPVEATRFNSPKTGKHPALPAMEIRCKNISGLGPCFSRVAHAA